MAVKSYGKGRKQNSHKLLNSDASNSAINLYLKSNENLSRDLTYNESKHGKLISPYISDNKKEAFSRNTKTSQNFTKMVDLVSYLQIKANSDDLNTKQMPRKTKKSVLTLPNKPVPLPQTCTVSEMNDSEYFQEPKYGKETKPSKKKQLKNKRRSSCMQKNMENYDELNGRLDCSSSSLIKDFSGDGIRKMKSKKNIKNKPVDSNVKDVWSIIRNLNKFRYISSPPMSQDSDSSLETYKNKKSLNHKSQKKRLGILYYDNDNSYSQSSFDRITVIDKQNELKNYVQNSDARKCLVRRNNNIVNNETQKHLNQNARSNQICVEEKNKYNDIKLWIKKINPLNSNRLSIQDSNIEIQYRQKERDIEGVNLKDDDCETAVQFNKDCRKGSSRSQLTKTNVNERKSGSICYKKSSTNLFHNQSNEAINGITKVVLNKPKRIEMQPIKTSTAVKSSLPNPKFTQMEVKRRLARMKFPIVILEKDQLSSAIEVNCEAPQFSGLSDHIWPFMVNWLNPMEIFKKDKCGRNFDNHLDLTENKNNFKEIQDDNDGIISNKFPGTKMIVEQQTKNQISALEHTKKSFLTNIVHKNCKKNKDVSTDTSTLSLRSKIVPFAKARNQQAPVKYSWASAKRASEFIENIIKKIKSGVYFNQEMEILKKIHIDSENKWTQTEIDSSNNDVNEPQLSLEISQECLDSIPGFGRNFTDLKIETFNRNQIAIKYCKTNVVVKFDIAPSQATQNNLRHKKSISFKPLLMLENKTKVFKCQKSILNTGLPAELCSILPKMVNNVIDFNKSIIISRTKDSKPLITNKWDSSPIRSVDNSLVIRNNLNKFDGHFQEKIVLRPTKDKTRLFLKPVTKINTNDLSDICITFLMDCEVCPTKYLFFDLMKHVHHKDNDVVSVGVENLKPICMSIQPYITTNKQIVPAYKRFNLLDMLVELQNLNNFLVAKHTPKTLEFKIPLWDKNIDKPLLKIKENYYNICDSIQEHRIVTTIMIQDLRDKKYNHIKASTNKSIRMKAGSQIHHSSRKRNNCHKYKKCKSMSNMRDSSPHTLLNNITSLHDFVQVLGSAKVLCSVLDKNMESVILSSLAVMKSWIAYITPSQALLVLLLVTKKESPNLVRYRLLILHGIAVNRITRLSELNMEIEVIENENFNKLPQFSGMNCLPESLENQDALLEELIWIAKTTASDYQMTFDECSEKHLRSLLEKRKKLNPSYLRVMARYVGLGLLKKSK